MQPLPSFSFITLVLKADFIIKVVVLCLIVLSLLSWAILFEKLFRFKNILNKADAFERRFWSGIMLEEFYEKNKNKLRHPVGEIFASGMNEWFTSKTNQSIHAIELIKVGLRERILQALDITTFKINEDLEKHVNIIGSIASISPFIGLFGTVWGIMNSFKAIAGASNVGLNVVAPGIAEALFTTALGILVAVFALIFHTIIISKLEQVNNKIKSFSLELVNILSRELDSFSIGNYDAYQKKTQQPANASTISPPK